MGRNGYDDYDYDADYDFEIDDQYFYADPPEAYDDGGSEYDTYDSQEAYDREVRRRAKPKGRRQNKRTRKRRRRPGRLVKRLVFLVLLLAILISAAVMLVARPPKVNQEWNLGERVNGMYTLLIVGRDKEGYNTDTMMLCSYDQKAKTMNVVNIPRDTMVNVSWFTKKANSLLSGMGSAEGMMSGIGDMLGFTPDNYVIISMEAFEAAVDAVGGVDFDVPLDMDYDDPYQDLSIHFSAGYQHLSGADALKVFRWRQNNGGGGYAMGDIGRIGTQQALLKAVAQQCLKPKNVTKAGTFMSIFNNFVETDLEMGNLIWYGLQFLRLDGESINFLTVPGNYGATMGGLSYVAIYPDEWLWMVNAYLNPYQSDITTGDVSILTVDGNGNSYVVGGY